MHGMEVGFAIGEGNLYLSLLEFSSKLSCGNGRKLCLC